jgi:lysophospholipase L1-like esterase
MTRRCLRNLVVNLLLATLSAVGFVVLLEVGTRALGLQTGFFLLADENNCLRRDRLLSLAFRSDCSGFMNETHFSTNSLGLRGDEVRGDRRRILAAGDSCTWGWGVGQTESYPAVLQRLLDGQALADTYDVINAGVPGHTSYQGLLYVRERGLATDPAVLIIGFGFNDGTPGGNIEAQLRRERRLMPVTLADDFILRHSSLYRWMRWQVEKRASQDREKRVPPEKYRQNLEAMVQLGHDHGASVLILSFWGEFNPSPYRNVLYQMASDMNVPLIEYKGPRFDIVHPTAEGYALLAEEIRDRLILEGYVR